MDLYYPTIADLVAVDMLPSPPKDNELSFRIKAAKGTRTLPPELLVASYDLLTSSLKGASFDAASFAASEVGSGRRKA